MMRLVKKKAQNGVAVLAVIGEIDMETAPELRAAISAALPDATALHLDVSEVSFVDSQGVTALVKGREEAAGAGIDFVVTRPQPRVLRVLHILGLAELFHLNTPGGEA